jgi:6-phosphofructokinase 1
MRIAVLTSGGDAPGMNGVVRVLGWDVLGVADGFQGLIAGRLHPPSDRGVGGILHRGGTILGTTRAPEFEMPEGQGAAGEALGRAGVEGVVVVGGGGSLRGALRLEKLGVPAVGPSRANSGPPTRDSGRA